jgi:hypothetical protein
MVMGGRLHNNLVVRAPDFNINLSLCMKSIYTENNTEPPLTALYYMVTNQSLACDIIEKLYGQIKVPKGCLKRLDLISFSNISFLLYIGA